MKLIINYDLLDKIRESKTGFSLQRTLKPVLIKAGISTIIIMLINAFIVSPEELLKEFFEAILISLNIQLLVHIPVDLILSKYVKILSKDTLKKLTIQLRQININTDENLILDSYKYKTEYKWIKSENDIDLVQKKYIMVPVIENGEEKEVSILQEHSIGSKTYSLSIGEPTKQKVYRLATNPI